MGTLAWLQNRTATARTERDAAQEALEKAYDALYGEGSSEENLATFDRALWDRNYAEIVLSATVKLCEDWAGCN